MKEVLYQKIADTLTTQIKKGILNTGDKMPSLRTLKREYGISMNTAIQVYLELESKGLITSRPQSGYYVHYNYNLLSIPEASKPKTSDETEFDEALIAEVFKTINNKDCTRLSLGVPENDLLPIARLNKELVNSMRSLEGSGTEYEEIQGNQKLRHNVARQTYTWGGKLEGDDIVTTTGAMNALSFGLMALTQRGDTIAVESPVYFGILQLAKSLGLKILELPTHPITGVDLDALRKIRPKIKLCILVSNFNNPLGSCMPEEHKKEAVKMLTEYNIPLIENDLYGDVFFGSSRPKPCKAFDEAGIVLWCGSVSKTLAPGYRVGWIAPGQYKDQVIHQKLIHTVSSTTITQQAIANFLENGRYEHHLRKLRKQLYHNSLQFIRVIAESFPEDTKISHPQGGFMLWVELNKNIDTVELYHRTMEKQISIAPGRMYSLQNMFNNCMRLSYGQVWSPNLESKLKILGDITKQML